MTLEIKGRIVLIDEADYYRLQSHTWMLRWDSRVHAVIDGKFTLLHRFILDAPPTCAKRLLDTLVLDSIVSAENGERELGNESLDRFRPKPKPRPHSAYKS